MRIGGDRRLMVTFGNGRREEMKRGNGRGCPPAIAAVERRWAMVGNKGGGQGAEDEIQA